MSSDKFIDFYEQVSLPRESLSRFSESPYEENLTDFTAENLNAPIDELLINNKFLLELINRKIKELSLILSRLNQTSVEEPREDSIFSSVAKTLEGIIQDRAVTPYGLAEKLRLQTSNSNDYAEWLPSSKPSQEGDLIALDLSSDREEYKPATFKDSVIVGVRTNPNTAFVIGENDPEHFIPVAFKGRVWVRFTGGSKLNATIGSPVYPSDIPGVVTDKKFNNSKVIGHIVCIDPKNPSKIKIILN